MVSEILQEDAEIPVPLEEFRYVRDVYQMFLPWPKHLILTTEGPLAQPPSRRDRQRESLDAFSTKPWCTGR
uniref:Uncharacterized protein n=1 Tax=Cannabis sativa TaxID=3483 RepID=A0A803R947_CANSA